VDIFSHILHFLFLSLGPAAAGEPGHRHKVWQ